MKIIYYSPHPTHDIVSEVGYATHQREVINALREAGHTVIPVIMGGTEKGQLSPQGITAAQGSLKARLKKIVPRFLWTSLKDFKLMQHDKNAARQLEAAIITEQPDMVYERSEYLQNKGVRVIKKYGIKYFLEINAPFVEEMNGFEGYSIWHSLAHKKEKNKIKKADKIFVVSSALEDFIIKRYGADPSKIILQPNCINPENVHPNQAAIDKLKYDNNLYGKKVIGFVGSIFPHHGVDMLIDAFETIAKQNDKTVLAIVGDGSIINSLKAKVEEKRLSEQVIFFGKQPHNTIYDFIGMMDICVMARSNWYGSPIKIFEYGIMGKPVIAPDTLPVRDVMDHQVHGLLVEMNDNEVSFAIATLLNDKALCDSVANNFKQLILEKYTWKMAAAKILEQV